MNARLDQIHLDIWMKTCPLGCGLWMNDEPLTNDYGPMNLKEP